MGRIRIPYHWILVLSVPSMYLLTASSNQFSPFSPHVVTPTYWYVSMVVTGAIAYALVREPGDFAKSALVVMLVNLAGFVGGYFYTMWTLVGYELAVLALNTLIRPVFLYGFVGSLLLLIGLVAGLIVVQFAE